MLTVTTEKIPQREYEILGLVKGSTIQCKNIGRDIGADAVVCMRFATSAIAQGAAEVIAYGTAVKFR